MGSTRSIALRARGLACASVLALATSGCAAAAPQVRVSGAFTPELARVFDDSVDYVEDVEGLGGRVANEWQRQVDALTRSADLIGEARVETVVQGQDQDGSRNYRLTAALSRVIRGAMPEENRVSLRVSEGQVGFNTVAGKEERLSTGRYVVFVRWYDGPNGSIAAHWHMSPRTDALVTRVRNTISDMTGQTPQETVVRTSTN